MLTIHGQARGGFCDGVSRRDFLKIGGLALGGLSMPQILQAQAAAGTGSSHKAVIMVFLAGGPPHQDMVDLKPDAPSGIRGEFKPIASKVPGMDLCEHLPRLAGMADRLAVIRTIVGAREEHAAVHCFTGYSEAQSRAQGGRPSIGAILSKLKGPADPTMPVSVGLTPRTGHRPWSNNGDPGFLGLAHAPFSPNDGGMDALRLPGDLSQARLQDRKALLRTFDAYRKTIESTAAVEGMDEFSRRAFEVLSSNKLVNALDVSREDPRLRARYGIGDMNHIDDGPPCCMDQFLMARRLVEAGVRCVTIGFGRWDYHDRNFAQCRERLPKLDMALSALLEDLYQRGMEKDVSVVVWGEFGRTPRINPQAGRDHWPRVSCAILAGGGLRTGQVIGQTNANAEVPKDRPITFQNVFATLYHQLGIEPGTTISDPIGRPMYLLDDFTPIPELI